MEIRELNAAWNWVLRLRDDSVTQDDVSEWLRWYEANERHKEAFEEMQAFWRGAAQVLDGSGAPTMVELLGTTPARRKAGTDRRTFFSWRPSLPLAVRVTGVTAALIAIVGLAFWLPRHLSDGRAVSAVVTRQTLPDGSRVELAAKSSIAVRYTSQERSLEFNDGEAYFSVARNAVRPFVVKVGDLRVRAVGTAFNIRKAAERVAVVVTEGTVEVSRAGNSNERERITAGNLGVWSAGSASPAIAPVDVGHTLAWRQGRLEYRNEPLSAVIADVNRYTKRPVVIRDPAVAQIVFSGTVFTDATDVWLRALPQVFPVEILTDGSGNMVLAMSTAK